MRSQCLVIILAIACLNDAEVKAQQRVWADKTERFSQKATLIDFNERDVRLLKPDDTVISISLEKLSDDDRKFVKDCLDRQAESTRLIHEAMKACEAKLYPAAASKLEEASKLDSLSIKASFFLGLMAVAVDHNYVYAEETFELCRNRWKDRFPHLSNTDQANYAAALNNLALLRVRRRNVRRALQLWDNAIDILDTTPNDIVQNLRTLSLVAISSKRNAGPADIIVDPSCANLLKSLTAKAKLGDSPLPQTPALGWLYMTYRVSPGLDDKPIHGDDPRFGPGAIPADMAGGLIPVQTGTGFIVHNGYVLTNRHVAFLDDSRKASNFIVFEGPDYQTPLPARLVEYDRAYDLALLHVSAKMNNPIRLYSDHPPKGTDIVALGFPMGDKFGLSITVTNGTVSRLPVRPALPDMQESASSSLWLDAVINSGSSGGPSVTKNGIVIGVNFATFNPGGDVIDKALFAGNYTLAVSSKTASDFVTRSIPDFRPARDLDGPGTVKDTHDSVVYIKALAPRGVVAGRRAGGRPPNSSVAANVHAVEDVGCMACGGAMVLPCPDRRCRNGVWKVPAVENRSSALGPGFGNYNARIEVNKRCETCDGKGVVKCPYCKSGVDPRFRPHDMALQLVH